MEEVSETFVARIRSGCMARKAGSLGLLFKMRHTIFRFFAEVANYHKKKLWTTEDGAAPVGVARHVHAAGRIVRVG